MAPPIMAAMPIIVMSRSERLRTRSDRGSVIILS
jgi:hypothetical protein